MTLQNLDTIVQNWLNGEPLHDTIIIGTIFIVFYEFYKVAFSSIFSIFKK